MKASTSKPFFHPIINSSIVLSIAELKRNTVSFLLPLCLYLSMLGYLGITGNNGLDRFGTWTMLLLAVVFAMIYGLQSFSNDADQKNLDFILTRPLSPYLIIGVKYLIGFGVLTAWLLLFTHTVKINLHFLPLVEGMNGEWLLLILLMIHAISFFSGLLTKGLERFFAVAVLTVGLAGVSYHIWSTVFNLIRANYFWFDILPDQMFFLQRILPAYLTLLGLATPLTGTVWFLRSRIPLYLFNPAKWLAGFWLGTYGLTLAANLLLAPPLWPDSTARYGDWHDHQGILLSGPLNENNSFSKINPNQAIAGRITLAKPSRKSKTLYRGINLQKPRFSPDGTRIVFAENQVIKILNLKNHHLTQVGPGHTAAWSADGLRLLCAEAIPERGASRFYMYNLQTGVIVFVNHQTLQVTDFTWDSQRNILYFLGYQDEFSSLNLNTQMLKTYQPATERDQPLNYYSIVHPTLLYVPETNQVVWGQAFEDELRIFELNPNGKITLVENLVSPRLKTAAPVVINHRFKAFLWQRIDGSFVWQATKYAIHKNDDHDHEHEPEH